MSFWIFKVASQDLYPDEHGKRYIFDNRHSVRVASGDSFIYLDKRRGQYAFTGHGAVRSVLGRSPSSAEPQISRRHTVYTAELEDFVEYQDPLDIRPNAARGQLNRAKLGIKNALGWGTSIPLLEQSMFDAILDLAYDTELPDVTPPANSEHEVPDTWSYTKKRHALGRFRKTVRERQGWTCLICGSKVREVIDVAHISPYASDPKNRANPANGIALCGFCHRAFDKHIIKIAPDAHVDVLTQDIVARFHGSRMLQADRVLLMRGVALGLLESRYQLTIN